MLGFSITVVDGRVEYDLADGAWKDLQSRLADVYHNENPTEYALYVIRGWLNSNAPAFESKRESRVAARVLEVAALVGLREISLAQVRRYVQSARDRWQVRREEYWRELEDSRVYFPEYKPLRRKEGRRELKDSRVHPPRRNKPSDRSQSTSRESSRCIATAPLVADEPNSPICSRPTSQGDPVALAQ